jgi:hypothetical protein
MKNHLWVIECKKNVKGSRYLPLKIAYYSRQRARDECELIRRASHMNLKYRVREYISEDAL